MDELNLNEYERVRRQKMEALRAKGIEPFGSAYKPTHHSAEILTQYHDKTKEELSIDFPIKFESELFDISYI